MLKVPPRITTLYSLAAMAIGLWMGVAAYFSYKAIFQPSYGQYLVAHVESLEKSDRIEFISRSEEEKPKVRSACPNLYLHVTQSGRVCVEDK